MDIRTRIAIEQAIRNGAFECAEENYQLLMGCSRVAYRQDAYPGPSGIGLTVHEYEFEITVPEVGTVGILIVGIGPGVDAIGGFREFKGWEWKYYIKG